jgi:carbon-monoxide dehydrogenase small subunit
MNVSLRVNGKPVTADIDPATLLSDFLRDGLDLTGTHVACDTSQCGACVVHVDGESVKSCTILAAAAAGAEVTTIEGVADQTTGELHPMQRAFHEHHGLQCGFCTPGMIMSAIDFANKHPSPTEAEVRHWLVGNFCRCTGYQNIVASILVGTAAMSATSQGS